MPVIAKCEYAAPFWLPGGDAQTMGPRLFHSVPAIPFVREQMELDDGDFLLVDWAYTSCSQKKLANRLAILSHGLEGDSTRSYMRVMATALLRRGWDVAARNFRGCGGIMNRLPALYHSGDTVDLDLVVRYAMGKGYTRIALVGFSMGGNQVLKYLGERVTDIPKTVTRSAAISVPCDLTGCSYQLAKPRNRIYMKYFLKTLCRKMREKHRTYPEMFPVEGIEKIRTFKEFDDLFTAPLNGFADAEDYWRRSSCLPYLGQITNPTLVINATNDPFLSEHCYPVSEAKETPSLFLLMPSQGGHVGFPTRFGKTVGWLENTVVDFLTDDKT